MVEYQVIPFAGYPICLIKTNKQLTNKELSFFDSLGQRTHEYGGLQLTNQDNILNNKELKKVKKFIFDYFNEYVEKVLEIDNKFVMCNSWGTLQNKGSFHPLHSHRNAFFSSVYYINAEESSITFSTQKSKIMEGYYVDYKIKNYNCFNSTSWKLDIESGDLVIFPGELAHHSEPNQSKNKRKIIGASYFIKGTLGVETDYNRMTV
jgi:uncharacterized protein (TIGR02466 family)|tara:strand:+ start:54 stop:671 length:618 start_codon:yes stop_codon:yes gene_type:complete